MKLRVGVVLSIATLGLVGAAPAAEARVVTCGEVITEDTVVSNDLDCVTDDYALTIGADDVTLNLNGHTVTARPDLDITEGTGALRIEQYDRVVIRNGYIDATGGFGIGIFAIGSGIRIANVSVTGYLALSLRGPDNTLARSTVFGIGSVLVGDRLVAEGFRSAHRGCRILRRGQPPTDPAQHVR